MKTADVDILLAAYNGERYIEQQIDSLLKQDYTAFRLIIADDCSTDRTVDIIRHYAKRYPDKIVYSINKKNSGAAATFFELLKSSTASYVMFCDQDDVWFENKISLSLERIKAEEKMLGINMPILLHTDLCVTDESLKVKAKSMFAMQQLNGDRNAVKYMAVQNMVTGCTMMLNRALASRLTAKPMPKSVPLHDWWIALYTACCGKIVFVDKPTIFYRQHGRNVCGAKNMSDISYILSRAKGRERSRLMLKYGYRQAGEMSSLFGDELGEENLRLLKGYGELENMPYIKRLNFVLKNGTFKSGLVRKLGQLVLL